ncbi:MAG: hypothetical protein A3G33_03855 [Omnitrophica bacterium RIFCSPLOWO2_12_FULL_44_17]|uniref:GIY-YIG domain-containing protein n=1 Tax=Candidatus Danuiimicrobium aquiferis TaxID=1801832 RepID=A0A1G1KSJ7_9BACT|nr:MAG: hypothetical protein A3B72_02115 [Omnitrophica bacterium RIFCSPHIGHO2_02_FULL_45_28]OGW91438.1 MAG: hypothetical protein A3E74_08380 [Omnitrophica bacterium RIFCSPHIGHO2_12_FULL_44_12]OGW95913.1 MAG: hypothetical protein A3G33_03855 [Omnitrophica bacterium RIFCSPLOWO2_12_FULL_44_17]OGX01912.1 MAG: hypothetical protein A3J12_05270 [Omnitrophica bacterium RIFCSPLOWO2_02_FULL_44_11]
MFLDGSHYVGSAQDVVMRLKQHNQKRNRSTKSRCPWKLVHQEEYRSRSEAVRRERFFKTGAGRNFLKNKLTVH